jgi:type VI secretion system protein ImpA
MELESLLAPARADGPCGPDLRSTLAYSQLQTLARGKEPQYLGDKISLPAVEPIWPDVAQEAAALLARSKDLRIATLFTRARVHTGGFAGLAEGLLLIRRLIEQFWDSVHPQLDRDNDGDASLRVRSLGDLAQEDLLLGPVRKLTVVSTPRVGKLSLRDVSVAPGVARAAGAPAPPDPAVVDGAFKDADPAELAETAATVHAAAEHALAIDALVNARLGTAGSSGLEPLTKLLADADRLLGTRTAARAGVPPPGAVAASPVRAANGAGAVADGSAYPTFIRSREDVIRALDAICEYYQEREPSSPLPILLVRARRLVSKGFVEIVQDLLPNGLDQLKALRGKDNDKPG